MPAFSGPGLSVPDARIPCMATAFDDTEAHPVTSTVAAVHAELDELADLGLLVPDARPRPADNLTALAALRHQITELELRHAHHADRLDLGAQAGAADTGSLLGQHHPADQTRRQAPPGPRHALDHDHEPVRDAMAAGQVSEEQAAVIVKGVDALPVEHRRDAETHLIGCAAEHDPVALRRLAHQVLEVVAPEIAEAHELKALQRQEALAEEACRFTIADDGHGLCHGRFTLPAPVGAMLKQAVLAINSPRAPPATPAPRRGSGTRSASTSPATPIDRLPQAGGVDATVVVTMTLENLLGDSQTPALLDTGDPITADQARKLACEAGIIPIVLGGKSEILDLGRKQAAPRPAPADRDPAPRPALHQPTAATGPPRCATSTTTSPGAEAARPTSPTDACCAPGTTPTPTHRSTR